MVLLLICSGLFSSLAVNQHTEVLDKGFQAAGDAVQLVINLTGVMALWLGIMRVLEAGGGTKKLAEVLGPFLRKIFPDIPKRHPALSAISLNISANMLGLGNAATPFGLRAMEQLQRLNPIPSLASHPMCLFLAINTSGVTILPLGVIGVRIAAGCEEPSTIIIPTLLATMLSTVTAIVFALLLRRFWPEEEKVLKEENSAALQDEATEYLEPEEDELSGTADVLGKTIGVTILVLTCYYTLLATRAAQASETLDINWISSITLPLLIPLFFSFGLIGGVRLYDALIAGAKDALNLVIRITPYMVIILVAIALFRNSPAFTSFESLLAPITGILGMPVEVLPMALLRPLSGSGAFGVMSALIQSEPNSYSAFLASVLMGSTETTFYVLAVYFGSVGVTKVRYALLAALGADLAGIIAACLISPYFY